MEFDTERQHQNNQNNPKRDYNTHNPFTKIYRDLQKKTEEQYLGYKRFLDYPALYLSNHINVQEDSIDNILNNESKAIADKMMTSAHAIADRIKIHDSINDRMMYNWLYTRNRILEQENTQIRRYAKTDRMASMLTGQLITIDKIMAEEKVKCWQDLQRPMGYFVDLYHKYKELKNDRKLLQ